MAMHIRLQPSSKVFYAYRPEDVTSLVKGHYGKVKNSKVYLQPEEVLFIMDIRNGICQDREGNNYEFDDILSMYANKPRFLTRYFTYKGWRDRGLIARPINECNGPYRRTPVKKYPKSKLKLKKQKLKGVFFKDELMTVVNGSEKTKLYYYDYWFGQYGTYKAEKRGVVTKYDIYETVFLIKQKVLKTNYTLKEIIRYAKKKHKFFELMYDVYEEWRKQGYVLKSGYKFGTHFRLYLPGAAPKRANKDWMHSKHVVHVFPKKGKLLTSEWSRVIRVAHSVRKTFIQAIPNNYNKKTKKMDYLLYHRYKGDLVTPKNGKPKYLMLSLSEEEYIDGKLLYSAIEECKKQGLRLLIAICDRETAITYYLVKMIDLPKSNNIYFEIEWVLP